MGNGADLATGNGTVGYTYNIGTYDVTIGQYAAFLNAVAASDPYALYYVGMDGDVLTTGISRSGMSGSYHYAVVGNPNVPAIDISWGAAARFANWMQNGQPTNLGEAAGSTETGAYTLNGHFDNAYLESVMRNPGATIVLPSQDEWYKAAYY